MITAAEALALPCAKLSEEQIASVEKILKELEAATREHMRHHGFDIKIAELDGAVIGAVNQRLKRLGWSTVWGKMTERHKLNASQVAHIGYLLTLAPSDAAYNEAGTVRLQ